MPDTVRLQLEALMPYERVPEAEQNFADNRILHSANFRDPDTGTTYGVMMWHESAPSIHIAIRLTDGQTFLVKRKVEEASSLLESSPPLLRDVRKEIERHIARYTPESKAA